MSQNKQRKCPLKSITICESRIEYVNEETSEFSPLLYSLSIFLGEEVVLSGRDSEALD